MTGTAATLLGWTPYLAGGFAVNLLIAVHAMLAGTLLGGGLGLLRQAGHPAFRAPAALATAVCRNVPSFVLMFYLAFLLPVEIAHAGAVIPVPLWVKAALALTLPVIGFASDQTAAFRRQVGAGVPEAGAIFLVAWLQYFLIVLMASATASVIGADEMVARANRVIATDQRPAFLLATYVYVSAWFLATGIAVTAAAPLLGRLAARGASGRGGIRRLYSR